MNNENIIPEAGNLFFALRNSGYNNIAALEDLIDNSIDAKADNVRVFIDNMDKIIIADDGVGMSLETLMQAVKLGGRKARDKAADLGKYGFGLITASISIGRRLTIITRNNHEYNTAIFDYDEVYNSNKFYATFRESSDTEIQSFAYRTNDAESGTVIIIDKCDKIQYDTVDGLVADLKESAKKVFRSFIRQGKNIIVNDVTLRCDDPLFRDNPNTVVRLNRTIMIRTDSGQHELHIFAVTIPDFGKNMNKSLRINIKTQGFYALRNDREIAAAMEIPEVFKKHNDYNLLRIELGFGPDLDDAMGVNYTKHNISPNETVINGLKRVLEDIVVTVRAEAKEKQKRNKEEKEKAKAELEARRNDIKGNIDGEAKAGNDAIDQPGIEHEKTAIVECKTSVRFKKESDPLFSLSIDNGEASLWYNGANDYYKNNFINETFGAEMKQRVDAVLEAMIKSCSQNGVSSDKIVKIVEDMALNFK